MSFVVTKDPRAKLDYCIDWSAWLGEDRISESTWDVPRDSGITAYDDTVDSGIRAVVWLRGGVVSRNYVRVTNHIKTLSGREEDRTILVAVKER